MIVWEVPLTLLISALVALMPVMTFASAAELPIKPDPTLTPGAVLTTDASRVCEAGYARSVRHVSGREKAAIYREYQLSRRESRFEVDHLISLELGGSNDISNLWPESYDTPTWNARSKDKLENALHHLVCDGRMALPAAQHAIATDWIGTYPRLVQEGMLEPAR